MSLRILAHRQPWLSFSRAATKLHVAHTVPKITGYESRRSPFLLADTGRFRQVCRMADPHLDAAPTEVKVTAGGGAIAVAWPGGATVTIDAANLRRACRCASCTAAREMGKPVAGEGAIAITVVEPIGGYAINIAFSDGHARGVYPWALFRELGGI
jgi:prepilin-type processing-associated H-X9-DG protein